MKVSKLAIPGALLAISTLFAVLPVSAQNYHYGYGSSRVVNQNNIGLHDHDSSYISAGCISDSARGVHNTGLRPNKLLPQVNWGRTVKTSGDNFYQYGAPALEDRSLYLPKVIVRKQKQPVRKQRQVRYYQPGDNANGGGAYSSSGGTFKYSSGGAMSYGESDNYKQNNYQINDGGSYSYGKYNRKSR